MVELNGGEAIGERDRGIIDEYLGISSESGLSPEVKENKELKGNVSFK